MSKQLPATQSRQLPTTGSAGLPMPASLDEVYKLGNLLHASGMFPDIKSQAAVAVRIMVGMEMGLSPLAAMDAIYISKGGKLGVHAKALAMQIKRSGVYDYDVLEHDDTICTLQFTKHGKPIGKPLTWTMERAKTAEILSGPTGHMWKKYPRNMLFAACIRDGARFYCMDIFAGAPQVVDDPDHVVDVELGERRAENARINQTAQEYADDRAAETGEETKIKLEDRLQAEIDEGSPERAESAQQELEMWQDVKAPDPTALMKAGAANGWKPPQLNRYIYDTYELQPGEIKSNMTQEQFDEALAYVGSNPPPAKAASKE